MNCHSSALNPSVLSRVKSKIFAIKLYMRIILVYFPVRGVVSAFAEHCLNFSFLALRQFFFFHLHKSCLSRSQSYKYQRSFLRITVLFCFFVSGLELKQQQQQPTLYLCCCGSFFLSCLLVMIKWCQAYEAQSLRPNKRLCPHSVYKKTKQKLFFSRSWGNERKTKFANELFISKSSPIISQSIVLFKCSERNHFIL